MPAADHLCACLAPTGAGLYTGAFTPRPAVMTPSELTAAPEASYPIGSRAELAAPFPVDRGIWTEPRFVSVFVKTPNGRWTSYPGNDVNYPTLAALALAAPVLSVTVPAAAQAPQQYGMATIPAPATSEAEDAAAFAEAINQAAAPAPAAPATRVNPLWLFVGAAALALVFFSRRR